MSPARHTPTGPDPATELAREIGRRHATRRRAPIAAAVAAVAVGVAIAAATDAGASTLDAGPDPASGGGHAAHALAGGGSAIGPGALTLTGRAAGDIRRSQGGPEDGSGEGGEGQDGRDRNGEGGADRRGDDRRGDDQANDGRGRNGGEGREDRDDDDTNGLDVLARDCGGSRLTEHTGFQIAPACVDTAFGEVAAADKGPSLLITDAPTEARVGESFTLKVSTRNLVRDRFLGAAAGGYYLESSVLTSGGLQRGHFHTACRMLNSTRRAPASGASPAFFEATQDDGGGSDPDTVSVTVKGLPERGTAQCTSWAGDGSHRVPMMQRADQTPAVDSVRITVR